MRGLFVTGTDTGVGKTRVAAALLRALVGAGFRAVGMKPVAAGFEPGSTANGDVLALAAAGNVDAPVRDRNPYAFAAPGRAAPRRRDGGTSRSSFREIAAACRRLAALADVVVVEGAGGALVPIDARHDMLDIAAALGLPVLLVVGMRLGCLNHALLTALAMQRRALDIARLGRALPAVADGAGASATSARSTERIGMAPIASRRCGRNAAIRRGRARDAGIRRASLVIDSLRLHDAAMPQCRSIPSAPTSSRRALAQPHRRNGADPC